MKLTKPKVSLVVVTLNRKWEIIRLLNSLVESSFKEFEIIIVDQNDISFLKDIIQNYTHLLNIKHILSKVKGAAYNRNIGLKYVVGDVLNFPDDDCYFERLTIEKAVGLISQYDAIGTRVVCPIENESSLINFPINDSVINIFNFYKCTIEFSIFWKKDKLENIGFFDEKLGVGTYFGSEEGADLIVRALNQNLKLYYFAETIIYHENQRIKKLEKVFSYALGHGAFIRKHLIISFNRYFIIYSLKYIFSSIFGIIFYLFKAEKRSIFMTRLKGVLVGFIKSKNIYN